MLLIFFSFPSTHGRNVHDPRALAVILEKAEEELARKRHPDPYIRTSHPSHAVDRLCDASLKTRSNVPWWFEVVRLSCAMFALGLLLILLVLTCLAPKHTGNVTCLYVLSP